MTFRFNSFEPAAKLNYVIEGVRLVCVQPRGLGFVTVSIHQCFLEDFSSDRKALLAGAELISLGCPSPEVGAEVPVPRLGSLALRKQIETKLKSLYFVINVSLFFSSSFAFHSVFLVACSAYRPVKLRNATCISTVRVFFGVARDIFYLCTFI